MRLRELIISEFGNRLVQVGPVDVVGGIAKSGTAWAAWLAWAVRMPFVNVLLTGPRATGLQREVEGDVNMQKVVLVDNWTRSGGSINQAIRIVRDAGGEVVAAIVVTKHPEVSLEIPCFAAWELADLVKCSIRRGMLPPDYALTNF